MKLRDYQREAIEKIISRSEGKLILHLATGLGKTVTFSRLEKFYDKILIIAHRNELLTQPQKYFNRSYNIIQGRNFDLSKDITAISIQTLRTRYTKIDPWLFDCIIVDEAHHTAAPDYQKILNYFNPALLLGCTATPNRADNLKLEHFDEIIYSKSLLWGIQNKYLSNIEYTRAKLEIDLDNLRNCQKDFSQAHLSELFNNTGEKIFKIWNKFCKNEPTLIFTTDVKRCFEYQSFIPGSIVITGKTKNRDELINEFNSGNCNTLINCNVFTEGTDIPRVKNIIMARPTKSEVLYTQMVGRGLRLYPNKTSCHIIDLVGNNTNNSLFTLPSLLGITLDDSVIKILPEKIDLLDLPNEITKQTIDWKFYKLNYKKVNIWAKRTGYNLNNVNWVQTNKNEWLLSFPGYYVKTSPVDELGQIVYKNKKYDLQNFFDMILKDLKTNHLDKRLLWDLTKVKSWKSKPLTPGQIRMLRANKVPLKDLNRLEGACIIGGLMK